MRSAQRRVALVLLSILAACAAPDSSAPPPLATTPAPAQLTEDAIITPDGAVLPLRAWLPDGPVKTVVLALHGFNDYSHAFAGPGRAWAKDGIATFAYDQRGFGAAPLRGGWAGTRQLDQDVVTASRLLRARYPGRPLYLLGESMGGAVAITAMAAAPGVARPPVDGVILAAPAVWARSSMNVFERVALWGAYHLVPGMTLTGNGLHIVPCDNIAIMRELSRDPMVIKETRIATIYGLVDLMDQAFAAAPRLKEPAIVLYGGHDEIIPAEPVRLWIAQLPPAPVVVAWYADGYHMLLRDLDAAVVLGDIESWISSPAVPLPSGADRRAAQILRQTG
jgi:alpha-beta hydrolase superfamily lysophospholipase